MKWAASIAAVCVYFCFCHSSPLWAKAFSFTRFLDHTWQCTTVGRTPLDKWSACCRDLYLTIHNTHDIHARGGIWTHNLSCAATGTGCVYISECKKHNVQQPLMGCLKWEPSFNENLSAAAPRVTLQPIPGLHCQTQTGNVEQVILLTVWDWRVFLSTSYYFEVSHFTSCFHSCGRSYRICQSQFWKPTYYNLFC